MADQFVSYPFADADVKAQVASASPIAVTIQNQETVLPIAQLAAAATLNLTIGAGLKAGANLTVRTSVAATNRLLTLGIGMTLHKHCLPTNLTLCAFSLMVPLLFTLLLTY